MKNKTSRSASFWLRTPVVIGKLSKPIWRGFFLRLALVVPMTAFWVSQSSLHAEMAPSALPAPQDLRCEGEREPLGISAIPPCL